MLKKFTNKLLSFGKENKKIRKKELIGSNKKINILKKQLIMKQKNDIMRQGNGEISSSMDIKK